MLIKQGKINVCGIYGIKTGLGVIRYVGGAGECNDAYSRHKSNLINGEYAETNKNELQVLFNTEQEDLIFYVIKECNENELDKEETKYIKLHSKTIVNKDKKGKRRRSKSTIEETLKRRKANSGENNPHNTKLCEEDVFEILDMLNDGIDRKIIAAKFDIQPTCISRFGKDRWVKEYQEWENNKNKVVSFGENTTHNTTFGDVVNL